MSEQRDHLETLLSKAPYIADEGFTEEVMGRAPCRRASLRTRTAVQIAAMIFSCGIVLLVPGVRRLLVEFDFAFIGSAFVAGSGALTIAFSAVLMVAASAALMVWIAVAAASSDS